MSFLLIFLLKVFVYVFKVLIDSLDASQLPETFQLLQPLNLRKELHFFSELERRCMFGGHDIISHLFKMVLHHLIACHLIFVIHFLAKLYNVCGINNFLVRFVSNVSDALVPDLGPLWVRVAGMEKRVVVVGAYRPHLLLADAGSHYTLQLAHSDRSDGTLRNRGGLGSSA